MGFAEDHRSIDGDFDKSRRLCLSLVPVLQKGERLLANVRETVFYMEDKTVANLCVQETCNGHRF